MFLAVTVDAAHPLLEPYGIPGDVDVDEHVAELEVDPLAGRLGRHQDLSLLLELTLGVDAGARRVAVADLHPAVNLRDRQAPLAELAQRPAVLAVAREVIQRVLVLGEEQQLHLGVGECTDLGQNAAELRELGADSPASSAAAWVIRADSRAMSSRSAAGSIEMTSFSSLERRSACSSSGSSSKSSGMRLSIRCLR